MKVEGIINRRLDISRRKKTFEEKDIKILEGSNIYEGIDGILIQKGSILQEKIKIYNESNDSFNNTDEEIGIMYINYYYQLQETDRLTELVIVNNNDNNDIIVAEVNNL